VGIVRGADKFAFGWALPFLAELFGTDEVRLEFSFLQLKPRTTNIEIVANMQIILFIPLLPTIKMKITAGTIFADELIKNKARLSSKAQTGFDFKKFNPATSYSPTQLPAQYHRLQEA
jgi:hypothetical protein